MRFPHPRITSIAGSFLLIALTLDFKSPAIAGDDSVGQGVVDGGQRSAPVRIAMAPRPAERPPGPSGPPGKDGEKPDEKKGDEKGNPDGDSATPKIVRRDGIDLPEGDPAELKATVGEDGKVSFRFRNQGWIDLIGWLSDISAQPIDWQELPGDAVNLVSPERLSVSETADLINRHLLARGFTMLRLEGGITITKTSNVNPGMVRRVSVEELQKLPDHTYVRTMLDAGWLSAEKLAEELKPMLSSSGKLTALATTNRIEAMDAAVNLRQVARLLTEERDVASRDALAPEFRLRHIPAEEAKRLLEEFLGVEKKDNTPMTREQMQMMQRMQQQNGGKPPQQKPEVEISIVANVRQNSVLVRAPIDRVAIAAEFIKRIDVPGGSLRSLADASTRVDVFRLVSLDPEKLIEIAMEMNVLEPTTRIRVDKDNSAVIVSGAAADRFIIKSLIERLDGGKRRFEVLQLRRLEASAVAESISFLMGQEKEDDDSSSRSRYSYYGFGGNNNDDKKDEDEFRVAANTSYRQVLLWANESEMEEVRSLLIKLGELPPPGGSGQTMRVIEASATPETLEYLRALKARWNSMSSTELVLPDESEFTAPGMGDDPDSEESEDVDASASGEGDGEEDGPSESNEEEGPRSEEPIVARERNSVTHDAQASAGRSDNPFTLTMQQNASTQPATENPPQAMTRRGDSRQSPPVEIRLDANGNLILSSNDTKALDALENLMLDMKPPTRPYHVFHVKNASVTLLTLDLEEYFEEEDDKKDDDSDNFYRWYWGGDDDSSDTGPTGLAKGGKLKFLPNSDTGTIIVTGATNGQLKTIEELIELWDVDEPINPTRSRFTKLVTIRYGRSEKIAETVKDAYRDLLSSNDKTFSKGGGGQGGKQRSSNRSEGSGLEDSESGRDGGGNDFSFNGKLSLGVDEIGNTLLVSAEGESLLELIVSMIEKLDMAAQPGGEIEIVRFSGDVSPEMLRQAMAAFGAKTEEPPRSERSRSRNDDRGRSRDRSSRD
ncbi:type II secretory pathway component GspD/PulD (secretin) [Rhodopirellula rubra]|uniref:Type II secretory pathway component GspD/PulD (Secretin) n=1 Tax=Aporhodopirellula rubra TaxID=980271 RepID=A0A7W5H4F7_9BACT|nr:secretin N-terminal domain-containing protein [Aporhodopirellula rubra]MBB3205118.1 type II secretory pathway component GspD/PulD (secretin) [Aporhodopirellula rubra]